MVFYIYRTGPIMERKMLNIREIAKLAGVGKSTVSRVINNTGYVSEDTRKRIEKVMKENGYHPSAVARSLSRQQTNSIGIIIPQVNNLFFNEIITGVENVVDENGYVLSFSNTNNDPDKENNAVLAFIEQRVSGIILQPTFSYEDAIYQEHLCKTLSRLQAPIVLVDRPLKHSVWDGVFFDGYLASYQATAALIESGNKTIGIITGNLDMQLARERFEGYIQAMKEHNIPVQEKYVLRGDFTMETAYKLVKECLKEGTVPDAFFTTNNFATIGFLKAIIENNMTIGRDIACISFDYIDFADVLGMNLSYVGRHNNMGELAGKLLIDRISNNELPQRIETVQPRLVLNGSEKKVR